MLTTLAALYLSEGNAALRSNNLEHAIVAYEEASLAAPTSAAPHRALGIAHARAGHGDLAVEHYRLYVRLNPQAPDAEAVRFIIESYESL